jgi:carboxyl-terminal processing protease
MALRLAALALALVLQPALPARADNSISILDVVELDMGYTTIADHYYRPVRPQTVLDGARTGIVAYLRGRGIGAPQVSLVHARPDGRGVVPAIEQQVGKAIERYGSRVDARALIDNAIRGELAALHDPYSVFFSRAELARFTSALDGRPFGGLGLVLASAADGTERIDRVFDGSPAARVGLVPGDTLVAVGGRPLRGLASDAVAALLRGPIGSTVALDVQGADGTMRQLSVARASITPPDVSAALLPNDVAYVALSDFGPTAGEQVRAALLRLRAQGARATIFDLRGNGGGYESSAVRVASTFVPTGTIVITVENHGHRSVTNADGTAPPAQPLAVLVDGDSASGAELVTGAIADHGLGTVIGTRTFGKGVVQSMFPLPDGSAMKVTTARYFTPSGRSIDRIGITPNLLVDEPADAQRGVPGHDRQLDAASAWLAGQLHALDQRSTSPVSQRSMSRRAIVSKNGRATFIRSWSARSSAGENQRASSSSAS